MLRAEQLVAGLSPEQREKLAGIQEDPRAAALLRGKVPAARRAHHGRAHLRDVEAHARREGDVVVLTAKGLALQLTPNARHRHPAEAGRVRAWERGTVARALADVKAPSGPWLVTITRMGPGTMDDDNATASAKGVRDAVAAWLGVDDGETGRVRFVVSQKTDRAFGVTITVKGGATW